MESKDDTHIQHGEHCLVERRGEESLNKEASWRALFGGAQGGEVQIKCNKR